MILPLFAFTTILAWSYYGEKAVEYLFGEKHGKKFKPANESEATQAETAIKNGKPVVKEVKKSITKSHALPPFTTST
ncbi:MAG: alanine:cation symporter family protein, partial [Clostridia bacterium]|nr:alanine:cation symporter family protein [Clostridia bacterium]